MDKYLSNEQKKLSENIDLMQKTVKNFKSNGWKFTTSNA